MKAVRRGAVEQVMAVRSAHARRADPNPRLHAKSTIEHRRSSQRHGNELSPDFAKPLIRAEAEPNTESHFFDHKAKEVSGAKVQRALVAFGNADGGELAVGIADAQEGIAPRDRPNAGPLPDSPNRDMGEGPNTAFQKMNLVRKGIAAKRHEALSRPAPQPQAPAVARPRNHRYLQFEVAGFRRPFRFGRLKASPPVVMACSRRRA